MESWASVALWCYAFSGVVVCSSRVQRGVAPASHLWPREIVGLVEISQNVDDSKLGHTRLELSPNVFSILLNF